MKCPIPIRALGLIISLSMVLTYGYVTELEIPSLEGRLELHREILDKEADSPYVYRVLVPYLTEAGALALGSVTPISYTHAWQASYVAYDLISIALFLSTLFVLLRRWYSDSLATLGVFLCAALLPVSLRDHYFQPWSLIEAWFFCLAYLLSFRGKLGVFLVLTAVASLNRITAIFIPLIYFLGAVEIEWVSERRYRRIASVALKAAALLAVAGVVLSALRIMQGQHPHIHTFATLWARNGSLSALARSAVNWALFLGAGWLLLPAGLRSADPSLRKLCWIIPLYLVPVILYGRWHEVRLLMPIYPLLIALVLAPLGRELRSS